MNKPRPARSLAVIAQSLLAESFAKQGFAATELVTRWRKIAGPVMCWISMAAEPATLVLRVEGPAAIEIQHMTGVIIDRVNRFFGWQAIGQIALRQAPLSVRKRPARPKTDTAEAERIAGTMTGIRDENLRLALGRLGAAVKQK
jgi:hypothetical protein